MKRLICFIVCLLLIGPALAETVQDQAMSFIQASGIAADSVSRIGDEIIVTLPGGGTAVLHSPGDFDPYNLAWRFDGASDEELALYLDHALTLLATLEAKIPADRTNLSAAESIRARSYEAIVSKGLLALEQVGKQGLNILLNRLSAHDDSSLNSLRARLASRLLGELDDTTVDPSEGLAWYDALTLPEEPSPLP